MEAERCTDVGMWRIESQKRTFVHLSTGPVGPVIICLSDGNKEDFVSEIPKEAKFVDGGLDSNGLVPSGVCKTLRIMLQIQKLCQ